MLYIQTFVISARLYYPHSISLFQDNRRNIYVLFVLDSNIYFCTFQQIFVYDGKTVQPVETSLRFNRSFLANGKLFTQTDKGRLLEVRGRTIADAYPQHIAAYGFAIREYGQSELLDDQDGSGKWKRVQIVSRYRCSYAKRAPGVR